MKQYIILKLNADITQLLHSDEVDMLIHGVIKPISTKAEGPSRY
jgi:hypothetical protein